jgi:hypothetical protein
VREVLEGLGGYPEGPKGIHGGACDVWNSQYQWEICVKADQGKFAKELSLLQVHQKRWKYV